MMTKKHSAEKTVRDIRRATRRHYSAEEKIRIVLEGLRGEDSIAELCRLNYYYLPSELQEHLQHFVNYYNHERYHESLDNLTPADVFYGRGQAILDQREKIKLNTLAMRRKMHYDNQTIYST
jgi:transposase InsO family protein